MPSDDHKNLMKTKGDLNKIARPITKSNTENKDSQIIRTIPYENFQEAPYKKFDNKEERFTFARLFQKKFRNSVSI